MTNELYGGFEQGPIKPSNEINSLVFRFSRNCSWNKCTFCSLYKNRDFSIRPKEQIMEDINLVHKHVESLMKLSGPKNKIPYELFVNLKKKVDKSEHVALHLARRWIEAGMESIFIQDADGLELKPADFIELLVHIKKCFPMAEKITTFARSYTIVRINDENLKKMGDVGLNKICIGVETGSDEVLKLVKKGCSKKDHIKAGEKIKRAGMTLSVNVMPGLGGVKYSREHALESADVINQINPDFICLRSFVTPENNEPFTENSKQLNEMPTDSFISKEILLFIKALDGITSTIESDHPLNLFEDVTGTLPRDKVKMMSTIEKFFTLDQERQAMYQIGKRSGVFSSIEDLDNAGLVKQVEEKCIQKGITPENLDQTILEMKQRFV